MAIRRLVQKGYDVVAIGKKSGWVEGVLIQTELQKHKNITTVSLYLNPKNQISYYDYIISLNPQRVIFNPGTENEDFIEKLATHGIQTEIACTLVLLSLNQY